MARFPVRHHLNCGYRFCNLITGWVGGGGGGEIVERAPLGNTFSPKSFGAQICPSSILRGVKRSVGHFCFVVMRTPLGDLLKPLMYIH